MVRKNKRTPLVSVIIPVRQLSYYLLFENLPALDEQTFRSFEVIVLPNEHSTYDLTLLKKYRWLRIIPTGTITRPAEKRNIGVKESRGTYIAFIDDDAYPAHTWLESAVRQMKLKRVRAVCGPGMIPSGATDWEQVFDLILRSRIGSGAYTYRFSQQPSRDVVDFPSMNFVMERSDFQLLGGFKNDYWPGEDSKLCNEITGQLKGTIRYNPAIAVYHHRRPSFRTFLKQHGQYGFHRGAFFAHGDHNSRELPYLIPSLFIIYLCLYLPLLVCSLFFHGIPLWIISLPLLVYGLLSVLFFIQSFIKSRNALTSFRAVLTLLSMHFMYGLEFIRGWRKGLNRDRSIYE